MLDQLSKMTKTKKKKKKSCTKLLQTCTTMIYKLDGFSHLAVFFSFCTHDFFIKILTTFSSLAIINKHSTYLTFLFPENNLVQTYYMFSNYSLLQVFYEILPCFCPHFSICSTTKKYCLLYKIKMFIDLLEINRILD